MRWTATARSACVLACGFAHLLLVGCASLSRTASDESAATPADRTIEGRISVRYKDLERDREESLSGRFDWSERGDAIELALLDPLGQTVALIRSAATGSSIRFRDGRLVEGTTPDALTQETLGWTVPMRGLAAWLDGHPAPATPSTAIDGHAINERFRQDGWVVAYTPPVESDKQGADAKPRRIDLSYAGPPVEIEMRLIVDRRSGS